MAIGLHLPTARAQPEQELPRQAYSIMAPVVAVHAAADVRSPTIGELQAPTVVTAVDTTEFGAWRHISGAGWNGWVSANQVSHPYPVTGLAEPHLTVPYSGLAPKP